MTDVKVKAPALIDQVETFWGNRKASGVDGLILLDKIIRKMAKDRDWTALSRFLVQAHRDESVKAKVVRIIRCAFGDRLTFKLDKKQPSGGAFVMINWPENQGVFPLSASNTYGVVTAAIKAGKGFLDPTFQKDLAEVLGKPEPKKREVTDAAKAKAAKHVSDYLIKLRADGFDVGAVLAEAQANIAKVALEVKAAAIKPQSGGIIELKAA